MTNHHQLSNARGQMIVEAVLMMVVFFGITFALSSFFKDEEILKRLVTTPWKTMSGMLQNGSWMTPEASHSQHPNGHFRHISIQGTPAGGGPPTLATGS